MYNQTLAGQKMICRRAASIYINDHHLLQNREGILTFTYAVLKASANKEIL